MTHEELKTLAKQITESVRGYVGTRLSPVETSLTQLEIRLAALEQKLAEREGADERLRAVK